MSMREVASMSVGEMVIERAKETLDRDMYRELHWTGSFTDYLDLVQTVRLESTAYRLGRRAETA